MTRIFTEAGAAVPVTVIEVLPNIITQLKTPEVDGYSAVQITTGTCKVTNLTKAVAGHYIKAGVAAGRGLWEFLLEAGDEANIKIGSAFDVNVFEAGQMVDVAATSKGKGFAGVIKRHNFSMQDATHGNSRSHRAPGSIGQRQSPGRVFKGKLMAGQMGNKRCTVQSQEIIRIDAERGVLLIKGTVPGAPGGDVIISPAKRFKRAKKHS